MNYIGSERGSYPSCRTPRLLSGMKFPAIRLGSLLPYTLACAETLERQLKRASGCQLPTVRYTWSEVSLINTPQIGSSGPFKSSSTGRLSKPRDACPASVKCLNVDSVSVKIKGTVPYFSLIFLLIWFCLAIVGCGPNDS